VVETYVDVSVTLGYDFVAEFERDEGSHLIDSKIGEHEFIHLTLDNDIGN
jgi:hypothetical protein